MRVKCIGKKPIYMLGSNFFKLIINKEYNVLGIELWDKSVVYFIAIDSEFPYWYPAEMFEIISNTLPVKYYFSFCAEFDIPLTAGYKELIELQQNTGIKERDSEDIEIFLKRKKEIDEFESLIK